MNDKGFFAKSTHVSAKRPLALKLAILLLLKLTADQPLQPDARRLKLKTVFESKFPAWKKRADNRMKR